ncbi:MAG: tyrosine-type recombinase/integrase, partial [Burkholderiaceae bacterium]|nr:tyrosine-type recombinase/integrase [Burkholderiaceae bacterium]
MAAGRRTGRAAGRAAAGTSRATRATGAPDPTGAGRPAGAAERWIAAFCDALWLEDGLARNTLAAYRRDLVLFGQWLAEQRGVPLHEAGEAELHGYIAHRHAGSRATSSNRRLTVFRRFFRYLVRERARSDDPTLHVRSARQPPRFPATLSERQVEALLAAPDVDTPLGLRDRAMLETLYATGLRVSELVTLAGVQVGLADGIVRVVGKGDRERLVPLGEEARGWIERYLREARPALLGARAADALFVTRRGEPMTRQMFWTLVRRYAIVA